MKYCFEVRNVNGNKGVYAVATILCNDVIMELEGTLVDQPTRYSIQLSENSHLEMPANGDVVSYFWRFLNHSCKPNTCIDVNQRHVVALRDIAKDEEITFNYNSTEYEMAEPFICSCNGNRVFVKGYKYLDQEQKNALENIVAPHLKKIS